MCRMMAKAGIEVTGIYEELESCEYSLHWLSQHGRQSHDPEIRGPHADGCGLGYFEKDKLVIQKRGKENFWDDSFRAFAQRARSRIFIAHDRLASSGLMIDEKGAHPFRNVIGGKEVALCHNGTARTLVPEAQERGISDSEIMLEKIAERTQKFDFESLVKTVKTMADEYDYSSITSFIMSEDKLFGWLIFDENDPKKIERYENYYTLYLSIRPQHVLIASEPIDQKLSWAKLPNRTFFEVSPEKDKIAIRYCEI